MKNVILSSVVLVLAPLGQAAGLPPLVEQALERMEAISLEDWAYTETTIENGSVTVERFDPSLPQDRQWTLVTKDDQPPAEEDLADYAAEKKEEGSGDTDDDLRELIDPGSIEFIEETPKSVVYRFRPRADDGDEEDAKFMKHVTGRLEIVKSGPYVGSMEMRNPKPFSAGLAVRMKEFLTRLTYRPVGAEGHVLPHTVEVGIEGRLFLLKKLREKVRVTFSDYVYVGNQTRQ